jgi:hypothetical protein
MELLILTASTRGCGRSASGRPAAPVDKSNLIGGAAFGEMRCLGRTFR